MLLSCQVHYFSSGDSNLVKWQHVYIRKKKTMQCKLNEHTFGVDIDREFACPKCLSTFVESKRVPWSREHIDRKVIKQNLQQRFGDNWRYEWFKLQVLQSLVKKITYSYYDREGLRIRLNGWKIYQLEDFILEPEEFIRINAE